MKEVGLITLHIQVYLSKRVIALGHAEFHFNYASFKNVKSQNFTHITSCMKPPTVKLCVTFFHPVGFLQLS